MCGIVGFLDKTDSAAPIGRVVLTMLNALDRRGPDSAGVALYPSAHNGNGALAEGSIVLRVKLGEQGDLDERSERVVERVRQLGTVSAATTTAEYLRLVLVYAGEPQRLEREIEAVADGIEVVSMGRALEIVKQVGSPQNLDATYGVSALTGTHGIGHTRLSTESRVDLRHSQPFWAHGYPDVAVVHNGHITNYHTLRRRYEQRGVKFYTDNDSEVIGVYLAERLSQGMELAEALTASVADLDGSFSYLAATADTIGFAKDRYAFKPLLFTETERFVAVATEELALHSAFRGESDVREAQAEEVRVWQR